MSDSGTSSPKATVVVHEAHSESTASEAHSPSSQSSRLDAPGCDWARAKMFAPDSPPASPKMHMAGFISAAQGEDTSNKRLLEEMRDMRCTLNNIVSMLEIDKHDSHGKPKLKFQDLLSKGRGVLKARAGVDNWRRTAALTKGILAKSDEKKKAPNIPVPAVVLQLQPESPPDSLHELDLGESSLYSPPEEDLKLQDNELGVSGMERSIVRPPPRSTSAALSDSEAKIKRADTIVSRKTVKEVHLKPKEKEEKKKGHGVLNPLKVRNQDDTMLFPDGLHKVVTDVLTLLSTFVEYLFISWMFSIRYDAAPVWYLVTVIALTPIHCYWIYTNFRTSFLTGWILTDQFETIRSEYLRKWFVFDLVVMLPWDVCFSQVSLVAFKVFTGVRFLKILRVPWLLRRSNPVQEKPVWVQIVLTFFWSVSTLHMAACSWLLIASHDDQGFVTEREYEVQRLRQYLTALYWACATISSTGYGDISAQSKPARVLACFWMWSGVLVIVYGGAKVTQWMVVADPFILAEQDKKRQLYALMTHNSIPWKIQKSALSVYPVVLETSSHDYNSIIEELPRFLQDQIRLHVKLKLIRKVPIFKGVSEDCLIAVAQVTVPEFYHLDSNVIEYGESGSEMFFLEHGIVEIYTYNEEGAEIWMANLKGGSFFGEISLMSEDCRRTATVRAVTTCIMYTLTKECFDHVVSLYPDLKRKVQSEAKSRLEDIQLNLKSIERMKKATRLLRLQPHPNDTPAKQHWKRIVMQVVLDRKKADDPEPSPEPIHQDDEVSAPKIGTFIEPINYHPHIMVEDDRDLGRDDAIRISESRRGSHVCVC